MEIIENMMIAAPDELCLFPSVYNYSACRLLLRKKGQKRPHFFFSEKKIRNQTRNVLFFSPFLIFL